MSGPGKFAVMAVLAATLLHAFPLFALAAAPARYACHHQENSQPVRRGPAANLCCTVHRSVVVQPSCVPQAPDLAAEDVAGSVSEDLRPHLQVHDRIEISAAPPGTGPLLI
jgi:hypothetical protein